MSEETTNQDAGGQDLDLASPPQVDDERWGMLERVLEALLLASDQPLSIEQLHRLLGNELGVTKKE